MSERIDIQVPEPLHELTAALRERDYDAMLVGGCVRDALLGLPIADFDLVTDAPTPLVRDLAERIAQVSAVYPIGERFGTIGLALEGGTTAEATLLRDGGAGAAGAAGGPQAAAAGDGAQAAAGDTLLTLAERFGADAALRDLTINAIAATIPDGELLDPVAGAADLRAGVLRAPGDPAGRFADDPLRVVRVARFTSTLGFAVEDATRAAMSLVAPELSRVAVERVRDELTKLLLGSDPAAGLRLLRDSGALAVLLPEVQALVGMAQPSFHDLDGFEHTAETVALAPATSVMRWAALLHDAGKPPCTTVEADGRIRFFHHAQEGARIARGVCERLRFSTDDTRAIEHLVATHMRFGELDTANDRATDRAVRALDLWAGTGGPGTARLVTAEAALELMLADLGATAGRGGVPQARAVLAAAIARSRERGTHAPARSPIGGRGLMRELGVEEGPQLGEMLRAITDAIEAGELAPEDRAGALRVARGVLGR